MKFRQLVLISLTIFSIVSLSVYAHPGRTDSKGGHANRSTGEYHYHHGYDEHSHRDIDGDGDLDCPYEFEDNTKHKDNVTDSFSSDKYSQFIPRQSQEDNQAEDRNKEVPEQKLNYKKIIGTILILGFCFPPLFFIPVYIYNAIHNLFQKLKKK